MLRIFTALVIASLCGIAACTTARQSTGYTICNDLDANVTCPTNTANVVVK